MIHYSRLCWGYGVTPTMRKITVYLTVLSHEWWSPFVFFLLYVVLTEQYTRYISLLPDKRIVSEWCVVIESLCQGEDEDMAVLVILESQNGTTTRIYSVGFEDRRRRDYVSSRKNPIPAAELLMIRDVLSELRKLKQQLQKSRVNRIVKRLLGNSKRFNWRWTKKLWRRSTRGSRRKKKEELETRRRSSLTPDPYVDRRSRSRSTSRSSARNGSLSQEGEEDRSSDSEQSEEDEPVEKTVEQECVFCGEKHKQGTVH